MSASHNYSPTYSPSSEYLPNYPPTLEKTLPLEKTSGRYATEVIEISASGTVTKYHPPPQGIQGMSGPPQARMSVMGGLGDMEMSMQQHGMGMGGVPVSRSPPRRDKVGIGLLLGNSENDIGLDV